MRIRGIFKQKQVLIIISVLIGFVIILRSLVLNQLRVSLTKEIMLALGSRNTSGQVVPNFDTTIINSGRCRPNLNQNVLMAVIVIFSRPNDVSPRNNAREQWRRWTESFETFRLIFFIGLPDENDFGNIHAESVKHDDMVVDAMPESYYSLTLKSLRMLKWFLATCSNVKYLVKSDVDVLIHLPNLLAYLNSVENQGPEFANKFIGGDLGVNAYPYYSPTNKWYMPPELLEAVGINYGSPYPDYVLGGFYVISTPLIPFIFNESLDVSLIHFEDIFLTGIVANKILGLKLTQIPYVSSRDKSYCLDRPYVNHKYPIIACHFGGDYKMMNEYYEFYRTQYTISLKTKSHSRTRRHRHSAVSG